MFEILQNFEQTVTRFDPIVLTGPGVATVIIGLFVWLGGLGFKKVYTGRDKDSCFYNYNFYVCHPVRLYYGGIFSPDT